MSEFGRPTDVLAVAEREPAPLPDGAARVDVLRAPINPSDVATIEGNYGELPVLPATPGLEGIGRVREVSGGGIEPGSIVILPGGETWSTEVVRPIDQLVPLPDVDDAMLDQLAMLSVNPATAFLLMREYVDLQPGDWIIQSAANSAVGQYVRQLGRARGIKVACVVRREEARAKLVADGVDAAFVDGPDLGEQVQSELGGMRLAFDAVAGETIGNLAESLEPGGTLVAFGGLSGQPARIDFGQLIFRGIEVKGFWLLPWLQQASPDELADVYGALAADVIAGDLHAETAPPFALEDYRQALEAYRQPGRDAKVLFAPNGT